LRQYVDFYCHCKTQRTAKYEEQQVICLPGWVVVLVEKALALAKATQKVSASGVVRHQNRFID